MKYITDVTKEIAKKKHNVTKLSLIEAKGWYTKLYHQAILGLYSSGYQSDPTEFSLGECRSSLIESGFNIVDNSGKFSMSEDILLAELYRTWYKNGKSGTVYDIDYGPVSTSVDLWNGGLLSYSLLALYLERQLSSLDTLWYSKESNGMHNRKKAEISLSSSYGQQGFQLKNKFPATESTIYAITGSLPGLKQYHSVLWDYIYGELGIPKSATESGESLIINGMSLRQEQSLLHSVISGRLRMDGKYSGAMAKWMREKVWENPKSKSVRLGDILREKKTDEIKSANFEWIVDAVSSCDPLAISDEGLWYSLGVQSDSWVMAGQVCYSRRGELSDIETILNGWNGEFLTEEDLGEPGVGVPCLVNDELVWTIEACRKAGLVDLDVPTSLSDDGLILNFGKVVSEELLLSEPHWSIFSGLNSAYVRGESGRFGPVRVPVESVSFSEVVSRVAEKVRNGGD